MTTLLGLRRTAALAVLPLALWAALPTVRWCDADGGNVTVVCFVSCASSACEPEVQGCEAGVTCSPLAVACAPAACGAESACGEASAMACGLAFCLGGPVGGDGVPADSPTRVEPPSVFAAVLVAALAAPAAPDRRIGPRSPDQVPPESPTRASLHPARAPPASA